MRYSCPVCAGWTVPFTRSELWCGPSGVPIELNVGTCGQCRSLVLMDPSEDAIATIKMRLGAAEAARKMAGSK